MVRSVTCFVLMLWSVSALASDVSPASMTSEVTVAGMTYRVDRTTPASSVGKAPIPVSPHIREIERDRFEIDRVLVNRYAYNVNALMKLGWVYPHVDETGRRDGYRIGGIRPGNILYQGGLRSRDIVMSVNGRPTRNMTQVLLAHSQLSFRDDFEVVVKRRGIIKVLNYSVVR